jgi:hypothetical protein
VVQFAAEWRCPPSALQDANNVETTMPVTLQFMQAVGVPESWAAALTRAGAGTKMAEAVDYFRAVLGDDWAGWDGRSHLAHYFNTGFQGCDVEWVRFHQLAQALDGLPNLDTLIRKDLGSSEWRQYISAAQALEFCGRMRQHGHAVELIQNTHLTSPDVRVRLADRLVTVEFKALHDADARAPWDEFDVKLHGILLPQRQITGLVADFLPPALDHVEAVGAALIDVIDSKSETMVELPGGSGHARFSEEVRATGFAHLGNPVAQRDDLTRILNNLGSRWVRQLRDVAGPTLLVVLTEGLFFVRPERLAHRVVEVVDAVRALLPGRKMLGGILLYEEPMMAPMHGPDVAGDETCRFVAGAVDNHARTILFIPNPHANVPLSVAEWAPLASADLDW